MCYIQYKFQYHNTERGLSCTIIDMNYVVKNGKFSDHYSSVHIYMMLDELSHKFWLPIFVNSEGSPTSERVITASRRTVTSN